MFCEKCGAKIPEGGRFCESCGAPVAPAANDSQATVSQPATPPAYPPQPKGPSALSTFFAKKKNRNIVIAVAAVVVVAIVALIVILSLPKTIVLDDYFTVVYEGHDGYGTARIEWKEEELKALNKEIFSGSKKSGGSLMDELGGALSSQLSLKYFVQISLTQEKGSLSNGDTVAIDYEVYEGFEEEYDVKIKLRKSSVTVEGLAPITTVDVMNGVTVTFEGFEGNGSLKVSLPEEAVTVLGTPYTMEYNDQWNGFSIALYDADGYRVDTIYYTFDRYEELSDGETLTLTLEGSGVEFYVQSYGLSFPETAATVTVKDLKPLQSFDPFSLITFSGSGYNTLGVLDGTVPSEPVVLGDYTATIEKEDSSYRLRFRVNIYNAEGESVYDYTITADRYEDLSNGDVITFSSYYDADYIRRHYGIIITTPEEPTVTVSGLEAPLDPAIFDHLNISFSGYEGYGVINMTAKDEVYTVGNYTFKLTPTLVTDGWSKSCSVTVVVADLAGTNLFTVEYRSYDFYNIEANGGSVTFTCRTGSSAREEYLRDFGILFEGEKQFTVSGLTPTTAVDPREKLTYSFAGENGSIVLTMTLNETSYVVGNYTINLEVVEEESWWSNYLRLKFTIVDNTTQAEVGSGNYTASAHTDLYEGGYIHLNDNFDRDAIAIATGLLFATEEPDIIVSTK